MAPAAGEKELVGHAVHTVEPEEGLYVPLAQYAQPAEDDLADPGGHTDRHTDAPA